MKMSMTTLRRIIKEELQAVYEAPGEHPDLEDAEDGKKTEPASKGQPDNQAGKPVGKKAASPPAAADAGEVPGDDTEKPAEADPADKDLEQQAAGDEEDDVADADETEKVGDQLVGKTVQSISANPKSKLMPGAVEIVFQFDQIPEPLKILVTKTGKIAYYFKGLHNEI